MPQFTVPVTLTLNARDAKQAHNKVALSSINDLEIPGLVGFSVGDPTPTTGKPHHPAPSSSQIENFLAKATAELETWDNSNEISTNNAIALSELVRESLEILSGLV